MSRLPRLPRLFVGLAVGVVVAACTTGSPTSTSGITTVDPWKKASALTPVERARLCHDYGRYVRSEAVVAQTNRYLCKMQAFFDGMNAAEDEAAKSRCQLRYDECMASYEGQPLSQSDDCGGFVDNLDDCEATVNDIVRCEVDVEAARAEIAAQDWCGVIKAGPGQTFPTEVHPESCNLGDVCPR
ncbi:hypothetical protein [Labilithrix luteola]|uniref:hypothetical protein n=1 Tax=Labilithrix luteola TaxID=1391654 RepID=UPI0011BACA45|nr:hypothetical protein [Labilithrix luteola]